MPSVSENERDILLIALSIKKGETAASYCKKAAKKADENSLATLEEFCKAPVKK